QGSGPAARSLPQAAVHSAQRRSRRESTWKLARVAACIDETSQLRSSDCGLQRTAAITASQIAALMTEKSCHKELRKNGCELRETPLQIQRIGCPRRCS